MKEKSVTSGVLKTIGVAVLIVGVICGLAVRHSMNVRVVTPVPWLRLTCAETHRRFKSAGQVEMSVADRWQLIATTAEPAIYLLEGDCALVTGTDQASVVCKDGRVSPLEHNDICDTTFASGRHIFCNQTRALDSQRIESMQEWSLDGKVTHAMDERLFSRYGGKDHAFDCYPQ